MKIISGLVALFLYLLTYIITYVLYFKYFHIDVVFYSALIVAVVSLIPLFLLLYVVHFTIYNKFEKLLIMIIAALMGYVVSISVPTVIDRSLSFYLLEKLHQHGGGIKLNSFTKIVKNEFMDEYRVVDARLTEQEKSGTIVIKNDCVLLTNRGENIAMFSSFFRENFLPKNRLLMGVYTDDLIYPHRNGVNDVGYQCKE